jgi:hypothetical protein
VFAFDEKHGTAKLKPFTHSLTHSLTHEESRRRTFALDLAPQAYNVAISRA